MSLFLHKLYHCHAWILIFFVFDNKEAFAQAMLTPEQKQRIDTVLLDTSAGPLKKWKQLEQYLLEEKVAWKAELRCDVFLIHPSNRGGSGINIFNMHSKAKSILESGADKGRLKGTAVCFEVNPHKRQEQSKLTQQLHQAHGEYMACVSGQERYLSVSCSHLSQFLKAVYTKCQTPEPSLGDSNGKLNAEQYHDPEFQSMLDRGWEWVVLPWGLEETWLSLVKLSHTFASFAISAIKDWRETKRSKIMWFFVWIIFIDESPALA